jgi:16S rRNA (cytidine1402-2'-O)-methyltransferase
LEEIVAIDEERELFLAKEISKRYQKYERGSAKVLLDTLSGTSIRGEWVVVIRGDRQEEKSLSFSEVKALDIPPKIKAKLLASLSDMSVKEWYAVLVKG